MCDENGLGEKEKEEGEKMRREGARRRRVSLHQSSPHTAAEAQLTRPPVLILSDSL